MERTVHFENIIRDPEEEAVGLFGDVHQDISISDYAAFEALKYMQGSWEETGTTLDVNDIEFVTNCVEDVIKSLQRWHKAWVATVAADMWIEQAAEYARLGDFDRASTLHAKAREARRTFNNQHVRKTLELMSRPYSKVEELLDAAESA